MTTGLHHLRESAPPFWFIVVCFLCLASGLRAPCARALSPDKAMTQYVHDVWKTKDGLPQNSVQAIVQTRDGYLWLGTPSGLVRFDGVRFTVFDRANTPAIQNSNVRALLEDRRQRLWIGTYGGGLLELSNGRFSAYTTRNGLAHDVVHSLYEDPHGDLWIGTAGGLSRLSNGRFRTYSVREGLSSNTVFRTQMDRNGTLWIGTQGGGLNRLSSGKITVFGASEGFPETYVGALLEDHQGTLWIGTYGGGVKKLRNGSLTTYGRKEGLSDDRVVSLYEDRDGNLWIGTYTGLNRLTDGKIATYKEQDGLPREMVGCIYEDRERNLWLGVASGGLHRLKDGVFTTYPTTEALTYGIAFPIYQQGQTLWIGTEGAGLTRVERGTFRTYSKKDGLAHDFVMSLAGGRDGSLWVGTYRGLNRFKDEHLTTVPLAASSPESVSALYEDRGGRLWIGTYGGGLLLRENGRVVRFGTKDGLSDPVIRCISEDPEGRLWIGTNRGLNRLQNRQFHVYTSREGLSGNVVTSLHEDGEGILWIGTRDGGLSRLKNGSFTACAARDGLPDDSVLQILEDDRNNLWMSSPKGVFRIARQELNEFAERRTRSLSSVIYGTTDGLKDNQCTGGFQPGGWKTGDGRLWFPTVKGVVVVDPDHLQTNPLRPPVLLERVIVDTAVVDLRESPRLRAGSRNFEFQYTALSLTAPEKVSFRYQLEGFDRDWVNAGSRRVAYYTNIPPGAYRFRVKAANNDGVWNEAGAAWRFDLAPHFYQTPLFYAFCAVGLALAGWGGFRLRLQQIRSHSAVLTERNRMAREIHDTLAQGFTGIVVQLEAAEDVLVNAPEEAQEHLAQARRLARASLGEARRSVWALRPQALEGADLPTALAASSREISAVTHIQVYFMVSGTPRALPSEVESNLLRVGQEALNNAVMHSGAREIVTELAFDPRKLRMRVADDGRGFDPEAPVSVEGGGFGLISMRERVESLGGQMSVRSAHGQGTEVLVEVPVT